MNKHIDQMTGMGNLVAPQLYHRKAVIQCV